jgi:hypothetical protein
VEFLLVLVVLAVAVLVIAGPLRRGRVEEHEAGESAARAELEAAKAAKYAEIRDAELDYRTGKLSEADWRGLDRQLRREAVEVLHRLDALGEVDERPPDRPGAEVARVRPGDGE